MAELATIARPYAEALFKATPPQEAAAVAEQVNELASIAADPSLRHFAVGALGHRRDELEDLVGARLRVVG